MVDSQLQTIAPSSASVSLLSDIGQVRNENQDRCGTFVRESGEQLVVVADGMGGHRGGATAALLAVDTMAQVFAESNYRGAPLLDEALDAANREVCREAEIDLELEGMGSTVVALLLGERNFVAHLGDSRCYRLRRGRLELLTEDHSTVMELVRAGRINLEEAESHPRRNEVLRSLGTAGDVEPDIIEIDAMPGDRYLLCTDGLTGVVSDGSIVELLMSHEIEAAAEALIHAANGAGGPDNITVAVAEIFGAAAAPGSPAEIAGEAATRLRRPAQPPIAAPRTASVRRLAVSAAILIGLLVIASTVWLAARHFGGNETSETPTATYPNEAP